MKKICERCFEEYEDGEIYQSKYFNKLFCIPCENEYKISLENFQIHFLNNQPERSKREDAETYIGTLPDYLNWSGSTTLRCGALDSMET